MPTRSAIPAQHKKAFVSREFTIGWRMNGVVLVHVSTTESYDGADAMMEVFCLRNELARTFN